MEKNKLFVGSLPWSITSDSLKELFAQYGEITEAIVISENPSYAFRFSDVSDVLNWEPFILNESLLNGENGLVECPDHLQLIELRMDEVYSGMTEELTSITLLSDTLTETGDAGILIVESGSQPIIIVEGT
jgi:RNA recognition motif-containing protein